MGFQVVIRPKRLIYYSNAVWPQYRLDNRSQWPGNGTLDYNTLPDFHNFRRRKGKWLEIPSVQAFFALRSRSSPWESRSASQIHLAHSGPHPPSTMSPDACSDFASSFDPSDHSPPPITPNPVAAPPNPVPQPPPYAPSSLPPSQAQATTTTAPKPPPLPVLEAKSDTSALPSTLRVPRLYSDLPRSPLYTWSEQL